MYIFSSSDKSLELTAAAFICSALDSVQVVEGDEWFVKCSEIKNLPKRNVYPPKNGIEDSRNNWYQGVIKSITPDCMIIALEPATELMKLEITTWPVPRKMNSLNISSKSINEGIFDFIHLAKKNLKYVTWSTIKKYGVKIFAESPREEVEKPGYDKDMHYKESLEVIDGATIDYFISHAWVDGSEWKFQVLKALSEKFMKENACTY
jgi:hypothetical protein